MRALDRVVRSVQVVAAVATAAFVILLFTYTRTKLG
jgi:predicted lysophospholipase L1 biosynthesis ABC-type transport system permease subunit